MRALDLHGAARELAKAIEKPVILVQFPDIYANESYYGLSYDEAYSQFRLAAPWFDPEKDSHTQGLVDMNLILVCDDEAEQERIFSQTKGDDPNDLNPYSGRLTVYMLTINSKGEAQNENT